MKFYKYHGAGNDFLIADGRGKSLNISPEYISAVCDRHTGFGADGVMVLEDSQDHDFRMRYYNSDGSGGMMCGNGGRCIVAFAADLGYKHFDFEAPDGLHIATVESAESFAPAARTVSLKMKDVAGAVRHEDGWFLDTGTRHFVKFVTDLATCDVFHEGRRLRQDPRFAPAGTNVNFVQVNAAGDISVRTYEKGVEDETLACGTGIVASAMASWLAENEKTGETPVNFKVHAKIADLAVSFIPMDNGIDPNNFRASEVWLTGPAAFVGTVETGF